jgi:lysozyme
METAEQILVSDLFRAERAVVRYINAELSDYQFDALVSFTFNCGTGALQRSTLRQKINYQLYDEAGAEFLKWVYVGSRRITGLVYRRMAEKRLFTGILA